MYVSPSGRRFAHAASAAVHVLETDDDLGSYYREYAPHTYAWLQHLQRTGDIGRVTRFDPFLRSILRRAGYREEQHVI